MKQGKLIRRAVSAALAGCMMFTLSAPALAESTDALMQLSIGSYRSSSLLSEENSFPAITVNGTKVTEENIGSILGAGKLSYNEATKTLESSESIKGDLTIDAKGVNIELHGNSGEAAVGGKLTVTNAQDVKVTAQSYVAVLGDVEISCDGKVEITSEESPTVAGDVTVKQASTVAISGESYGYHILSLSPSRTRARAAWQAASSIPAASTSTLILRAACLLTRVVRPSTQKQMLCTLRPLRRGRLP